MGRKNAKKKLVVFAIDRTVKEVSRMYGKVIPKSSSKELGGFMKTTIGLDAQIKTDKWRGYAPFDSGKKGGNFLDLHRCIMGFKGWLRGMHHQVENLQAYIDEYCYRFNRSYMKDGIFDNLLNRIKADPFPYKPNIT